MGNPKFPVCQDELGRRLTALAPAGGTVSMGLWLSIGCAFYVQLPSLRSGGKYKKNYKFKLGLELGTLPTPSCCVPSRVLYYTLSLEHSRQRSRPQRSTDPHYTEEGGNRGWTGSSVPFLMLPPRLFQPGNEAGAPGVHLISQLVSTLGWL